MSVALRSPSLTSCQPDEGRLVYNPRGISLPLTEKTAGGGAGAQRLVTCFVPKHLGAGAGHLTLQTPDFHLENEQLEYWSLTVTVY